MCLYPRLIANKKYQPNKNNGGKPDYERMASPDFDKRVLAVPIGCNKCMECKKQKAREWQVRLLEDVRHNTNGKFITLTFSNENIKKLALEVTKKSKKVKKGKKTLTDKNGKEVVRYKYDTINEDIILNGYETDNAIAKLGVRYFLERWRKKYKKSLRHWLVTELGHNGTENVHLHGFVWTNENIEELEKLWKYGFIWIGRDTNGQIKNYVNERTVNYCIKYITKIDFDHKHYQPKILTSAGIGRGYITRSDSEKNKYAGTETKEYYTTRTGHKMSLPIYWRNKVYTDEEREKLWLQKLDKQERWVCGNKIDIKDGEEEYYKTLEWYRAKNKQLGYSGEEQEWEKKDYEEQRRNMLNAKRIKNSSGGDFVQTGRRPGAGECLAEQRGAITWGSDEWY